MSVYRPCTLFWSSLSDVHLLQVLVCTPGRLIDLVKMKACNLERVTYLVFDEADRCFDMGFEPQVMNSQILLKDCTEGQNLVVLRHKNIHFPTSLRVSEQ